MKRTIASLCTALLAVPVGLAATAGASASASTAPASESVAAAATTTSRLVALPPDRALDTRSGLGAPAGPVAPGGSVTLALAGTHGVPADATAVVLNVTITEATGAGYVQAYPAGTLLQGQSSNLNVEQPGQTIPNLVIVPLGTGGVTLYNQAGGHLVADVLGAFVPAETSTVGRYQTIDPARLLDTREGVGAPAAKPGPGGVVELQVTGRGGVPAAGVAAVALNVTATEATGAGYVQVVPTQGATLLGSSSNLNAAAGQTIANMVIVPVGAGGKVTLYTSAGSHLIADVTGWFTDASADDSTVGLFTPVDPERLLNTRTGDKPAANTAVSLRPIGQAGVPSAGVAAVALNVTATEATAPGYVQAYPAGTLLQGRSSTLNVERAGQTIPNATIATLGTNSTVALYTQSGTHLLADVSGWFSAPFSLDPGDDPGDGGDPDDPPPPPPDPTGPVATYSLPLTIPGLSPRLVFSTIDRTPTDPQSVTVHNGGQQPLDLGVKRIGTHPQNFSLPSFPGVPIEMAGTVTVAPGASVDIPVVFAPAVNNQFKVHNAQLEITTNDPSNPRIIVNLKGLNAFGFEGPNEPTLEDVLGTVGFGAVETGTDTLIFPDSKPDLKGDEASVNGQRVLRFKRADSTQPVVVLPIGSYTANHPVPGTVHVKAVGGATDLLQTFPADGAPPNYHENQKLFPIPTGQTSFPAGTAGWPDPFAIVVNGNNSTDVVTPECTTFRVYPAQITESNVLPNTYLVAADLDCMNFDYNDYVFMVANVLLRA